MLPDADLAELRALSGVSSVEQRGNSVLVTTADSDLLARHLLTRTAARDLEIAAVDLEDAFVALTADDPSAVTG
jgi:ABC-2 type transport system ATP-binding protein